MAKKAVKEARLEASVEDADILSDNWSDEVLACRSGIFNHQFAAYTAQLNPKLKYVYVVMVCNTCGTKKHSEISATTGAVIGSNWYTYPPGYLSKGTGRIIGDAKDLVRKKSLDRLFNVARMTAKEARDDSPRPSTLRVLQGGE